jgi:hypothetical protein
VHQPELQLKPSLAFFAEESRASEAGLDSHRLLYGTRARERRSGGSAPRIGVVTAKLCILAIGLLRLNSAGETTSESRLCPILHSLENHDA